MNSSLSTTAPPGRVRSIDWLRGLVVVLMIECHALHLLSPSHNNDAARHLLNTINGLPAPTFIFCAGLSLAIACSRIDRDLKARYGRFIRSIKRIVIVLLSSLLLKQLHWNVFGLPERLIWPNVLDCIALSLAAILIIMLFVPARRIILTLLFLTLIAIAPMVQKQDYGFITPLINNSVYSDTWPLVPWGGYACLGAIIGLSMKRPTGENWLMQLFLIMGFTGLLASICWPFFDLIYLPKYTGFYITNAGERCAYIGLFGFLLCLLEKYARNHPLIISNPFTKLIELYSRQSLVAYIGHLLIFYGLWFIRPYNRFHQQCDWLLYSLLAISLMIVTAILCYLFDIAPKILAKISIQRDAR